jgi:hypothetical protein
MCYQKNKKEGNGIKINLSLLVFKYEKEPYTVAKILCSQIKDSLDVVFPTNGNKKYNRVIKQQRNKYYKALLNGIIEQCNILEGKI